MLNVVENDSQETEKIVSANAGSNMSIRENPLFENDVTTAGPVHQARREQ